MGRVEESVSETRSVASPDKEGLSHPYRKRSLFNATCIVLTCTFAMVVNTAAATTVSIALPRIGRDLDIPEDKLQWLVSAYSLSSGCLLIFLGRLSDLHGRKKYFIGGALWLGIFALGCGFAPNQMTLDVLRGLQGVGTAAMIPAALGILAHSFPPSRARSIAFATFSAGAPIGGAVGVQVGGALTEFSKYTWRSPFFLTAGLAVICASGGLLSVDADVPSTEIDKRVDWLGALLVTTGLVLVTFVLSEGEIAPQGWRTPYIIALLIIGVALISVFFYWQWWLERLHDSPNRSAKSIWTPPPLMKLSIWRRAKGLFAVMQLIAFLNWSAFMSWIFWAQLYYQNYEDLSPVRTMVRLLPMMITGILCNVFVAIVVGHIKVVYLVVIGTLLTATACLLFALIDPSSPYWAFGFPAAILIVIGADFTFASGTLFVAKVSLPHEQSLAGALFQTLTQLGTAFGLAITTIVHNRVVRAQSLKLGVPTNIFGDNAPPPAQLLGYKAAQWTAMGFALSGMLCAAIFLRGIGIVGHVQAKRIDIVPGDEGGLSGDAVHAVNSSHDHDKQLNDDEKMPNAEEKRPNDEENLLNPEEERPNDEEKGRTTGSDD